MKIGYKQCVKVNGCHGMSYQGDCLTEWAKELIPSVKNSAFWIDLKSEKLIQAIIWQTAV